MHANRLTASHHSPVNSPAHSYAYCERLARRSASSFYPAFRLLPNAQRRAMCALYAFLRVTDDLVDEPGTEAEQLAALADWRRATDLCLNGDYCHPLHAALAHTVKACQIPHEYLHAAIDGAEMDLHRTTYATFGELYQYCYRVASVVGLACIHIWGFHGDRAREYAENAGIAFQLTNILRDLGEDADRGRIYLPVEDLDRFGLAPKDLCNTRALANGLRPPGFTELMQFEVGRARSYYDAARPLVPLLRRPGRAVFFMMARTYRGLLDEIERRSYDVYSRRVRVSVWRKLAYIAEAIPFRWGWYDKVSSDE